MCIHVVKLIIVSLPYVFTEKMCQQLLLMCPLMGCHIPSPAVSFPCPHGRDTEKPGMLCLNHATVSHKKQK
jgi:hypothetical protein